MTENCALILGDYINGYAIVKELFDNNVENIIVVTYNKKLAYFSSMVKESYEIKQSKNDLLSILNTLKRTYSKLILFPTDDWFVEQITELEYHIQDFCFIPFNPSNSLECSNKVIQYEFCEKYEIPFPKTISINTKQDFEKIYDINYPLIIKPVVRNDLSIDVFRSRLFQNSIDLEQGIPDLSRLIDHGIRFLISEVVPGKSHGNIYAYSAYISKDGQILNEWAGRKLSQYPDDYGVFSSASNEAPDVILEQGRKLVLSMGITGFCEPEFKFDYRDGLYKLMEVNLRSMMWNEVGRISGVNLHYTQWRYANDLSIPKYIQDRSKKVILFYYKHELLNLIFQKDYSMIFKSLWKEPNKYWAGCYKNDFKPIYKNLIITLKTIISRFKK